MKLSLNKKLALILVGFGLMALICGTIFTYFGFQSKLEERFVNDKVAMVEMINASLKEPVFTYDFEQSKSIAEAIAAAALVHGIEVTDHRGKPISSSGEIKQNDFIESHEIIRKGKVIGKIQISFNHDVVYSELNNQMFSTTGSILLVLVIVVVAAFVALRKMVVEPINHVADSLFDIASGDGDLTKRLDEETNDEIGVLSKNFNLLMDNLSQLMLNVSAISGRVNVVAHTLGQGATEAESTTQTQQGQIEQVATALQEMSASATEVAGNAQETSVKTKEAMSQVHDGVEQVQINSTVILGLSKQISTTADRIGELRNASTTIGSVVEVIRSIAEQTNLLALNAAIEAARAGEQGRGFAVVADEVRSLAQKTQESTQEIEAIVSQVQQGAESANSSMLESLESSEKVNDAASRVSHVLDEVRELIVTINDMNSHVATASQQQSHVAQEISENVTSVNDLSHAVAENAQSVSTQVHELEQYNQELVDSISQFKV